MNFTFNREWLLKRLAISGDDNIAAGNTSLEEISRIADKRRVSPPTESERLTGIGKVVRSRREERGWTQQQLADNANVDVSDIIALEEQAGFVPSPRAVIFLADALGFSRARFKAAAGCIVPARAANDVEAIAFAANSNGIHAMSEEEFQALRALVEVLSKKDNEPE